MDLSTSPFAGGVTQNDAEPGELRLPFAQLATLVRSWAEDRRAFAARPEWATTDEGFVLETDGGGGASAAVADQPSAARLALVLDTVDGRSDPPLHGQRLGQTGAIPDRAVLECFYGPLWSEEDRLAVLASAADHGATSYVYGPAADARTGGAWREPYGDAERERLERLVDAAHARGVAVTWRVSPSAPLQRTRAMVMSDDDDMRLLEDRLVDVARLGVDRVIVAFDDIDGELDAATRAAFAEDPDPLAAAHAAVLNRMSRRLAELGVPLLACPTHYWGTTMSRYRTRLGELLDQGIATCWTGRAVVSPAVTAEEARAVAQQTGRPVWLWDNVPVNDWDGQGETFTNAMRPRRAPLYAVVGRDPALADTLAGYGSNAALGPRTGLPAVVSALDWAWDPVGYQPGASLHRALVETGLDPQALALVADATGPHVAGPVDAGRLAAACAAVVAAAAGSPGRVSTMAAAQAALVAHRDAARAVAAAEGRLAAELAQWAEALAVGAEAGLSALQVLAAYGHDQDAVDGAAPRLREARAAMAGHDVTIASGQLTALVELARGLAAGGSPPPPPQED